MFFMSFIKYLVVKALAKEDEEAHCVAYIKHDLVPYPLEVSYDI